MLTGNGWLTGVYIATSVLMSVPPVIASMYGTIQIRKDWSEYGAGIAASLLDLAVLLGDMTPGGLRREPGCGSVLLINCCISRSNSSRVPLVSAVVGALSPVQ